MGDFSVVEGFGAFFQKLDPSKPQGSDRTIFGGRAHIAKGCPSHRRRKPNAPWERVKKPLGHDGRTSPIDFSQGEKRKVKFMGDWEIFTEFII
jgi:hypothetical protein